MNCKINLDVSCPDLMVSSTNAEINPVRWLTCEQDISELNSLNKLAESKK